MTEERRRQPSVLIVLLAAALATYFVDLGGSSIWDANEAFYVETPREMIEHGDYVSPTFNYEPRLNKPVLSYWIVAAFYHLFGVSVGVQRLPIALGALVLVASAFFLARAAWCDGSSRATEAGLWAALGLAIAPRFLMFARRIFIDIYISMFLSLSLLFFVLSERHPHRRRLWLVLMYVSIGLGMLTKGPVAAVLPAFALAAYFLLHGQRRRVREMMIPAGAAIVLAIVVPWYAALYVRDGWTYITAFFLGENVARFTDGYGVQSARGPLFYIPVVFGDSFPWSVFLPAAAATWVADLRQRRHLDTSPGLRVRNLLWLWILTIVGFFTLSAAKQDLYILPIVPAVAALGGLAIVRGTDGVEGRASGLVRALVAVLGVALFFLGAAVILLFGGSGAVYGLKGA
ncbi:MAG TPA: glycosyltransferase family 39 protein, partial [Vicinamibacterales bacterium]|nr:glycosyltransferase family 39 protein [Vicinamibacterales bacterium]